MTTLGDLGEREIITRLSKLLPPGLGDDTAVVSANAGTDWLLTSDPLIEGVHFFPGTEPARAGHKAVGRVLSDVAAMGGEPCWLLTNVVAPAALEMNWLAEFYRGANALVERCGASLVGGDMAEGSVFQCHVFGVGQLPAGTAVRRSGAKTGDAVYVTGALGGSLNGHHLDFMPRLAEGGWLRAEGWANAMIDLSDGLASDLLRITEESGVGARLDASNIPVSKSVLEKPGEKTALAHALTDGEDYELLFTVSGNRAGDFDSAWREKFEVPCTRIGRMDKDVKGVAGLHETAYEHFKT